MSRQRRKTRASPGRGDLDASLEQMRSALSCALFELLAAARAQPEPAFAARRVADLAESWATSALAMIDSAYGAGAADAHSRGLDSQLPETGALPASSAEIRSALLASLRLIVDATRGGRNDVDVACTRFANTYCECLSSAVAGTALRVATAFEEALGIPPGTPN
jgi:hypothetical protein